MTFPFYEPSSESLTFSSWFQWYRTHFSCRWCTYGSWPLWNPPWAVSKISRIECSWHVHPIFLMKWWSVPLKQMYRGWWLDIKSCSTCTKQNVDLVNNGMCAHSYSLHCPEFVSTLTLELDSPILMIWFLANMVANIWNCVINILFLLLMEYNGNCSEWFFSFRFCLLPSYHCVLNFWSVKTKPNLSVGIFGSHFLK
jgi:hypothetical protein